VENAGDYRLERIGSTLYIYLAHSNGKEDWANNLDFLPVRHKRRLMLSCLSIPKRAYRVETDQEKGWFAHRGFLRVWKSVEGYIADAVLDPGVKRIVCVGYSHGAALAVLCHEYVWYHRQDLRDPIEGYGFGCPRVFWGECTPELAERWKNFTVIRNLNDPVTHLPPSFLGFTHVGTMLTIGTRGKYSAFDAHRPENIKKELSLLEKQTVY